MGTFLTTAAAAALAGCAAWAQTPDVPDNLEKLSSFQTTGTRDFTFIGQKGDYADGIRRTLERIELRDGSILVSDDLAGGAVYRISYGE